MAIDRIARKIAADKDLAGLKINTLVIGGTPHRAEYTLTEGAQSIVENKISLYTSKEG